MSSKKFSLFFFTTLLLLRLSLLGRGSLTWIDEQRYIGILRGMRLLLEGDGFQAFSLLLGETHARPAMVAVFFLPALLQVLREHFLQVQLLSPVELYIPTALNAILATVCCLQVYLLARKSFLESASAPWLCTLLFSFCTPSFYYVRHLVPYYAALCFFLWACLRLFDIGKHSTTVHYLALGSLSALTFVTYPGYYFAVPTIAGALLLKLGRASWPHPLLQFCAGALLPLVIIEAVAACFSFSYLAVLSQLSQTVNIGSFDESFTFLPEYLIQVDGPIGVLLLAGAAAFLLCLGTRTGRAKLRGLLRPDFVYIAISLASLLLTHAALGYFARHMVFYGRLLLPAYAIMVIMTVGGLYALVGSSFRAYLGAALVALGLGSFLPRVEEFYALEYPRDGLYTVHASAETINRLTFVEERENCLRYSLPLHPAPGDSLLGNQLTLVNFCDYFHVTRLLPTFSPPPTSRNLLYGPHFLSFPAYQYEGLAPEERNLIRATRLSLAAYAP